jgi:hypothetical protein
MIYETNVSLLNHDMLTALHNMDKNLMTAYKNFTNEFIKFYNRCSDEDVDILEMHKDDISSLLDEELDMRHQFNRYHRELVKFDSKYSGVGKAQINMDLFTKRVIKLIEKDSNESTCTGSSKLKSTTSKPVQKSKRM